jgi:hypothetical protein
VLGLLQVSELKNHSTDKALRFFIEETLHQSGFWSKFIDPAIENLRNPIDS